MAVNADFAGRYPPSGPYAVDAAALAAFAAAVGSSDPVHTDREAAQAAGYRDVIAPPTFAVSIAQQCDRQLIEDPEAGIDFSRVVHGEQRFVHHRPITAGDEVLGALTVDSVRRGRPCDGDHPHRALHRRGRGPVHRHLDDRHPGRGVSMAPRTLAATAVGDTIGPVRSPSPGRRWSPTPTPPATRTPSTRTRLREVGRAARRHRPRHVDHGGRRLRGRGVGRRRWPRRRVRHRFTKPSSCRRTAQIEVSGVVKSVDEQARRATVELTTTCNGEKVLGRCLAVVQLD